MNKEIDIYFSHRNYLRQFKPSVKMEDAAESFFKDVKGMDRIYKMLQDSTLLRWDIFSRKNKNSYLINYQIKEINDLLRNKRDITKYGTPSEFGTLYKIRKIINSYLGEHLDENPIDWFDKGFSPEMEALKEDEEVNKHINNQNVFNRVAGKNIEVSLLDFYAKVKSYGFYMDSNYEIEDIVTEAKDYIRSNPLVVSTP